MSNYKKQLTIATCYLFATISNANTVNVDIYASDNKIGQIIFTDSAYGLLIQPELASLTPGVHGLHIHQHPNCNNHGMDAGAHFDPKNTNTHQGPYGNGHLGDLPVLFVNSEGKANITTLAPRLTTKDLTNHAIMVHEGGDNYSDNPALGGGGARVACGKVPT